MPKEALLGDLKSGLLRELLCGLCNFPLQQTISQPTASH